MNPRFLRYYSQELQHLREVGGEFANEFPKIAGRLGLEGFECADPYVERLLEGFSFLAARVQMKIDAEFPRFTQHLSELVYPQFLAPTPSMAVVQLNPDLSNPSLATGFLVPRQSILRSIAGKGDSTPCEYRTAHDVTMWPLELTEAKFFTHAGNQAGLEVQLPIGVKAGIRFRLRACGDLKIKNLSLDNLTLYIRGGDEMPMRIYEKILGSVEGVLVTPMARPASWHQLLPKRSVKTLGFDEDQSLLPSGKRSFRGYRLLQEYFAFSQRFLFFELTGLQAAISRCNENEIDITILLNRSDVQLEQTLDASNFSLNCTPAINLFPRRADRINVSPENFEYHVLADRTRPMDFEIFQIQDVMGYGTGAGSEQQFQPFYTAKDLSSQSQSKAFYQIRREKRVASERQRQRGPRSSYIGSEAFISIVDADNAPYRSDLRQLGLGVLCTNRDLPLSMPLGTGKTDFILDTDAPVLSVRCVAGPSQPLPSFAEGDMAWRLLNHLSLNYLSLVDTDPEQGASSLRELLELYCQSGDLTAKRQIDGVRSVQSARITRRMPSPGPITFGRGLQITVTMDDAAFEGTGVFLLGAVLEQFFAQYVSINSFTETVIKTISRGEIMRWMTREGQCETL